MGIYTPEQGNRTNVPSYETPVLTGPAYRNTLVESEYVNNTSLLTNVTGIPVKVTYLRQHISENEERLS